MDLKKKILQIKENIKKYKRPEQEVTLLAASKGQSIEKIDLAITLGLRCFGENKVQEAEKKHFNKSPNTELHLIGTLQGNKAKRAVSLFDVIQTVDSFKIAEKINNHAKDQDKVQRIFCQVNIGNDPKKKGLTSKIKTTITEISKMKNITLEGIMTIPPQNIDKSELTKLFQKMKDIQKSIETQLPTCTTVSMGMSQDYKLAIQCGSNLVRIGTEIFGPREI